MKHFLIAGTLVLSSQAALAEGLDFSGQVSMGLQSTTINGETEIEPVARLEGTVSYTVETDNGVRFILALNIDTNLLEPEQTILPGHR